MKLRIFETFKDFKNREGLRSRILFCRDTTQKPMHRFPFMGEAETEALLPLPSVDGGPGYYRGVGGFCLIDRKMSIKPFTGPALRMYLTNKKTHLYFGVERRSTKRKVQTIINLNFYKMKKQILFLAMITLAFIFAGTSKVFGQGALPSSTVPRIGTCDSYPLHPRAGVPYTYEVTNPNGLANGYFWWATKETNFIDLTTFQPDTLNKLNVEAGELISATPDYGTLGTGNTSIEITWSPEILANTEYASGGSPNPTFVVVAAEGDCNNNLQVYEINPSPSFTVDITNIDPSTNAPVAYDTPVEQCVDIVRSAVYNSGTGEINMDYGTDTLYFEVIAANFVTSWVPTFEIIAGLSGDQEVTEISWDYDLATLQGSGPYVDGSTGNYVVGSTVTGSVNLVADASVANTANGVSIFVKVVIENHTWESIADQDFILAVDGEDSTGQWDLVNSDCTDPGAADQADQATHTVTARPDIDDATSDDGVIEPNDFQPKN